MAPDMSWSIWTFLWLFGGVLLGPFLAPLLTSFVVGWVLQIGYSARLWGVALRDCNGPVVVGVPSAWRMAALAGRLDDRFHPDGAFSVVSVVAKTGATQRLETEPRQPRPRFYMNAPPGSG